MTADEIRALEEGHQIRVTWRGGDGPYNYEVTWHRGLPYAVRRDVHPPYGLFLINPLLFSIHDRHSVHKIERVE